MKNIFIVFVLFNVVSCVSFDSGQYNRDLIKINEKNYKMLNASYENAPFERIAGKDFKETLYSWKDACLKDYIEHNSDLYIPNCDKDKIPELKIDKQNNKYYLIVNYDSSEGEKVEYKIEGSFSNGFFKLDNYRFKSRGIPYIFGGRNISQSRIGLDSNRNLIIENASSNEGALLLIFWAGHSGSYSLKFKRINKN